MAENEAEKSHVLMQECIISEFGRCQAGHMLSVTDVHSGTWEWLQRNRFLKSVADIQAEADSEPGDESKHPGPGANDEGQTVELLTRVKALLETSKHQKSKIALALGCDETILDSVLTEANGIETKGGGWYSLKPVPPAE